MRIFDHLGGQVIEGPTVSLPFGLNVLDKVGPAEVSQFKIPLLVYEDIFRLDITMNNISLVNVNQGVNNLVDILRNFLLRQFFLREFIHHIAI